MISTFGLEVGGEARVYCFEDGEVAPSSFACREVLDEREADLAPASRDCDVLELLWDLDSESILDLVAVGVLDDSAADLDLAEIACERCERDNASARLWWELFVMRSFSSSSSCSTR